MRALVELVTCVPSSRVEELRSGLEGDGFLVLELKGSTAADKPSFLSAVQRDLPGEGSLRPHNWDAFLDVVRRGLAGTGSDRLVVLWTSADRMEEGCLQDFLIAVRTFTDLLRDCYRESPLGRFHLVLAGDSPRFDC